jgi:hypothetical protein
MLTSKIIALLLSALQPSAIVIVPELPITCSTNSQCEERAAEYGCSDWHDLFWCNGEKYRFAVARHSA